jgi:hypothetical protein
VVFYGTCNIGFAFWQPMSIGKNTSGIPVYFRQRPHYLPNMLIAREATAMIVIPMPLTPRIWAMILITGLPRPRSLCSLRTKWVEYAIISRLSSTRE